MARAIAVFVGLQHVPVGITPHVPRNRLLYFQTLESVSTTLVPSWSFPIRQVPWVSGSGNCQNKINNAAKPINMQMLD